MSSKKLPVSINVFPTLDYIELIQLDAKTGQLEKTASLPCQFDPVTRQVTDRDALLQTIRDLYSMCRIPTTTPAVLVLPGLFSREIELPAEFKKEELRFALVSEAERFYLFKKSEPQIDWINLDEERLFYAAFPKPEIEKFQKVFQELRIPLIAIELGYFAMLRGLLTTGAVQEEVESISRWAMLSISDSSLFAAILDGIKIVRTTEAPLSLSEDEAAAVIQEIQQDFEIFIEGEHLSKLVIVNNSSHQGLDMLLSTFPSVNNTIFIEQNSKTLGSRGATEAIYPCSLEGLGGIFYKEFAEMPELNFLPENSEDVVGIQNIQQTAVKWLAISNGLVFLLFICIWGLFWAINLAKDHDVQELTKKTNEIAQSVDPSRLNDIRRKKFIKSVVDENVAINNFLITLGTHVKDDIWLDKIELISAGFEQPFQVDIEGQTLNSLPDVNKLPSVLGAVLKNSSLQVTNAAQNTSADGQTYFSWTIQDEASSKATPNQAGGHP